MNMNAAYEALPADRCAALDPLQTSNQRISSARLANANPNTVAKQAGLPSLLWSILWCEPIQSVARRRSGFIRGRRKRPLT